MWQTSNVQKQDAAMLIIMKINYLKLYLIFIMFIFINISNIYEQPHTLDSFILTGILKFEIWIYM